ncbi:MAG: dehydratase [Deltaproteobacteria bacterium]|nr:dehydratase [Deltaproteobacteria bacterium]
MLYYDDLTIGYCYGIQAPAAAPYGNHEVTAEQIIAFAQSWDPRPLHTDPEAARTSTFGGLIASGAHTFALWTRLALDAARESEPIAILAGLGSEFRLAAPIRPGDILDLRVEIASMRPSRSRADAGIVTAQHSMSNQRGETVFDSRAVSLVGREGSAG